MSPRSVQFDSQGLKLAGLLWVPANTDTKKHAAIVIGHPMGAVKEQTPSVYAEHLNKLGFVTLVFDAAYQGESEGLPRYLEDPSHRVEDIKNAVSYLTTLEQVDSDRIGLVGICASGGYATTAAQTDVRIKALATISAADAGSLFRDGFHYTNTAEQLQKGLAEAAQDRTNEANGQAPRVIPIIPTAEIAATLPDKSLFKEGYEYYGTPRAQHCRAPSVYLARSLDKLVNYHAFDQADLISPRPALYIAGSIADSKYYSEEAYNKSAEPKELFLVEGASHIDLYDKPEFVNPVVEKLDTYFTQHLSA
jgi:fermentation-respiration switch protein FrsA (DUF1100 family)